MGLTDNSLMPFGQYRGEKMANVPAKYLLWLYDGNIRNAEVRAYIVENMDVLKEEVKREEEAYYEN
jgi:Uncharacterized protein conserved in bacteria